MVARYLVVLLGLAAIPVLMWLCDHEDHPYQFVKLLITVSPLHALGAVALAASLSRLLAGGLRVCPASRSFIIAAHTSASASVQS